MVGTQLVAGAFNKEYQGKLLSEMASLYSLADILTGCALHAGEV